MTRRGVVVTLLMLFVTTARGQTVIHVDADATGANDGSSWSDAFNHLQGALDVANTGDQIRVAEGTYMPDGGYVPVAGEHVSGSGNRDAAFQLLSGVALVGGYAGLGAGDPNARDPATYETILSGDLNGDDEPDFENNDDNSYHVVTASGTDATAMLDGFTITGGNADDQSFPNSDGGGMHITNATPIVSNCLFVGNFGFRGGGIAIQMESDATVTGCQIMGNSASFGGGIHVDHSEPLIESCTLRENSATAGGAVYSVDSTPTVRSCAITKNSVTAHGGGVHIFFSGGLIANCVMSQNTAGGVGGALSVQFGSATVSDCLIGQNSASAGGGVSVFLAEMTMRNCTIINNSAIGGGGIYSDDAISQITDAIVWGNQSEAPGNEIRLSGVSSMVIAYSDVELEDNGVLVGVSSTLEWGPGNIEADPLFADPDGGDLRLTAESPCVDVGDPEFEPEAGQTDLDGHARVLCERMDMGAYEFGIGDYDCDRDVDLFDFAEYFGCRTGPESGPYAEGCEAFDFNADMDVDLADLGGFQIAFVDTGP